MPEKSVSRWNSTWRLGHRGPLRGTRIASGFVTCVLDLEPCIANIVQPSSEILFQTSPQQSSKEGRSLDRQRVPIGLLRDDECQRVSHVFARKRTLARSASRIGRTRMPICPRVCPPACRAPVLDSCTPPCRASRRPPSSSRARDRRRLRTASIAARPVSIAFANPKSSTFTVPSGRILMFAGFRSRWMIPCSCAASRASAICLAMGSASSIGIGPWRDAVGQRRALDQFHHERLKPSLLPGRRSPRCSDD